MLQQVVHKGQHLFSGGWAMPAQQPVAAPPAEGACLKKARPPEEGAAKKAPPPEKGAAFGPEAFPLLKEDWERSFAAGAANRGGHAVPGGPGSSLLW